MIKNSLLNRRKIAKAAAIFVGVTKFDKNGRPRVLNVPGSEGKEYQVILRRKGRMLTTECCLIAGRNNFVPCQGNCRCKDKTKETICYHSMAAVNYAIEHKFEWDLRQRKYIASESGFKASWCTSEKDAQRLVNMNGGTIFNIKSQQNTNGIAYIVVKRVS